MNKDGATVVRRQLGRRMKSLREDAGKTMTQVQEAKYASTTKLWRMESGLVPVKVGDVLALARLYGADSATTDHLVAMAEASTRPGWWQDYEVDMPVDFQFFLGLESSAPRISSYESEFVPGLLQTADYSLAHARATLLTPQTQEEIQAALAFRLERQRQVFGRSEAPLVTVLLNAAVLARVVGDAQVMINQREHLLRLSKRKRVEIRVLPWDVGAHRAMFGAFKLFEFDDPATDPAVVYHELIGGGLYLEKPFQITRYRAALDSALHQSVPLTEYLS